MFKPRIAYLEDPAFLEAHISWLLRKADRLKRLAPRIKEEDERQECLRAVEVLLDRAEDLVRDAMDSLPEPVVLEGIGRTKPASSFTGTPAFKLWADFVTRTALI